MQKKLFLAGAVLTAFAMSFATADDTTAKCTADKDAKDAAKGECPYMAKQKKSGCCAGKTESAPMGHCTGMQAEADKKAGDKTEAAKAEPVAAPATGAQGVKVFLGPDGKPTNPTKEQINSLPKMDTSRAFGPSEPGDPNDPSKGVKVKVLAPTTYMIAVKNPDGTNRVECKEGTDPNALLKEVQAEAKKEAEAPAKPAEGGKK